MLVAIGMYLPFGTTSAMFLGGIICWIADGVALRRGYNEAQRARVGRREPGDVFSSRAAARR